MPKKAHGRDLPNELLLPILLMAIETSHSAACSISLVSTWCRALALSHVFSALAISPTFRPPPGRRTRPGVLPPDMFPAKHGPLVHALWAGNTRLQTHSLRSVFDACRGVADLALSWDRFRDLVGSRFLFSQPVLGAAAEKGRPHPDALHYPRAHVASPVRALTVLGPWISFLWRDDAVSTRAGCSLFLSLTHLRIVEFEPRKLPLFRLPNLTHLSVAPSPEFTHPEPGAQPASLISVPRVMESDDAPRIEMVVLTVDLEHSSLPLEELQRLAFQEDERLHVVHAPPKLAAVRKEWVNSARGGESIWARAVREREDWMANDHDISPTPSIAEPSFERTFFEKRE